MTWPHHLQSSEFAQGDDDPDVEAVSDLYGRKHVNRFENADGVYLLQKDTETIHTFFKIPGVGSTNAMRKFLANHLPNIPVTDEYGYAVSIEEVSPDHLPKLQAHLWLSEANQSPPTSEVRPQVRAPAFQRRSNASRPSPQQAAASEDLLRIACHVTFITELLQVNHIFINRKKSTGVCELSSCPSRSKTGSHSSPLITIEALIHWGTVTPATGISPCPARIQVFRRDGEKCDDPLWTQAIEKLTPQHPTSYCLECLGMMMEKRSIALQAMRKQKPASFTAVNGASAFKPQGRLFKADHGFKAQYRNSVYNDSMSFVTEDRDEEDLGVFAPAASLNLDGPSDIKKKSRVIPLRPGRNKYGFPIFADPYLELATVPNSSDSDVEEINKATVRKTKKKGAFSILLDARDSKEQAITPGGDANDTPDITSSSRGDPVPTETSFTSNSMTMNEDSAISVWATVNRPRSPSSTQSTNRNHHCPATQSTSTEGPQEAYDLENSHSRTPTRNTRREFGRELDANLPSSTVTVTVKQSLTIETSKTDMTAQTDIRDFLAKFSKEPPKQMSTSPYSDDTANSPEPKSSESWETTASSSSPLRSDDRKNGDQVPRQPSTPPKSTSPKSSPPSLKLTPIRKVSPSGPFFAKFDTHPTPDTSLVSPQSFAAHLTRVPSPSETICTCRLPPSTSALAQCSNTTCVFVWLHYDCLDKAAKLSARHGRLVCQHCRNEKEFRDGDDVGSMGRREVEFKYSGEEVVAAMPGLGGVIGVGDPYGLGSMMRATEMGMEEEVKDDEGALGALGFMVYMESRPGEVGEAYLEPGKYAERVRKMVAEGEQEEEEEEEEEEEDAYWYEEGYEYEDEEYGYEDEEQEGEVAGDTAGLQGDGEDGEEMEVDK